MDILGLLLEATGVQEGLLISTCNRTEFYVEAEQPERQAGS